MVTASKTGIRLGGTLVRAHQHGDQDRQVYMPYPFYRTLYGYYGTLAPVIYTPGYLQTVRVAQVETNFYASTPPDGQLVWTGTTNSFNVGASSRTSSKSP